MSQLKGIYGNPSASYLNSKQVPVPYYMYVVGWIGYAAGVIFAMYLVGLCLWSTALQAFWVYQLWKYEPGTVLVVPKYTETEEKVGLPVSEKCQPVNKQY